MPTTKKVKSKKPIVSKTLKRTRRGGAFEELRDKKMKKLMHSLGKQNKGK